MSLRGLEMAREIMAQPALKPFVRKEVLPGPKATPQEVLDYAVSIAKTDHHPVGTCRMGHDEMAVVDPQLRLRGIDGLRVCDASVMPSINSSNTNAPTIMIGEKASDVVRGRDPLPAVVFGEARNDRRRELA
jgi:choline dehydrogenase-like flavoprotein